MEDIPAQELIAKLKTNLVRAMKSRQSTEMSTLRSILARISNAEAVLVPDQAPPAASAPIVGASIGVGSTEVPRKQLDYADLQRLIHAEIQDLQTAVQQLEASSHYAAELSRKIALLRAYQ